MNRGRPGAKPKSAVQAGGSARRGAEESDEPQAIRLQKLLARAGIASRRRAEALIREGRVSVDGRTVTELGVRVDPNKSRVFLDGAAIGEQEAQATVLLYKPDNVVTTLSDPEGRTTVKDLLDEPYRMVPIGRLDYHTEGVLLLTNHGELAHRLLHPRFKAPKVYRVKVGGAPSEAALDSLRRGVDLEDGRTLPAMVEVLRSEGRRTWLEIIINEGRNHQVRRMCEAIDHRPLAVIRSSFAGLTGEGLRAGQYRYLSLGELKGLFRLCGLDPKDAALSARAEDHGTRPLGRPFRAQKEGLKPKTPAARGRPPKKPAVGGRRSKKVQSRR